MRGSGVGERERGGENTSARWQFDTALHDLFPRFLFYVVSALALALIVL